MIGLSVFFGVFSALAGYWFAHWIDASISGSMATILGLVFLLTYLFAPNKGLIAVLTKESQQKKEISLLTFLLHIKNHSQRGNDFTEREISHFTKGHFNWQNKFANKTIDLALRNNMIRIESNLVELTPKGDQFTSEAINFIVDNKRSEIEEMKDRFLLFRE
jgi:manganese/zinc/iron transport system permease protein